MIDKINNEFSQNYADKIGPNKPEGGKPSQKPSPDAVLSTDYANLIDKANQLQTEDTAALEKARQLLLSGQLDTPENIRCAAENIVNLGL
jgi:hypothetical protein